MSVESWNTGAAVTLLAYAVVVFGFRRCTAEHIPKDAATVAALVAAVSAVGLFKTDSRVYSAAVAAVMAVVWRTQVRGPKPSALMDMKGRRVVVTGANSGIGAETARRLAGLGAHVVMACRTRSSAEAVLEEITSAGGSGEIVQLDLSSFESVRKCAKTISDGGVVDVLVNNAGMMNPERRVTGDGVEQTMQVNFLSPLLLTSELIPCMRKSTLTGGGRVVNVNSASAHLGMNGGWPQGPASVNLDDMMMERRYDMFSAYGQSKLSYAIACVGMAKKLDEEGGVTVNSLHPGTIQTNITRSMPLLMRVGQVTMKPYIKPSLAAGSDTTVYLAASHNVATVTGGWYEMCAPAPCPSRKHMHAADGVKEFARKWTGVEI